MPWKETKVLDQRVRFINEYDKKEVSLAGLCRSFGISRKTAYEFIARRKEEGEAGLLDRSRAPHRQANQLSDEMEEVILKLRGEHPTWGPRKLLACLGRQQPALRLPAASTVGDLLRRHGLVTRRRRRPRATPSPHPLTDAVAPNSLWCADFKGWFLTGDGRKCTPFTLVDASSRYLLRCQALSITDIGVVKPLMEAAFREYGLPEVIRTDNGPPFASHGLGGLSKLAIWWLKLGIVPERIAPGRPEENGRQERLHRTLKQDVTSQPAKNLRGQQHAFDLYLSLYNNERPHEALAYQCPADIYLPSSRRYPDREPEFSYPKECSLRQVRHSGEIRWQGGTLFLSEVLAGEQVGLLRLSERQWALYVGPLPLAILLDDGAKRAWLPAPKAAPLLAILRGEQDPLDGRTTPWNHV